MFWGFDWMVLDGWIINLHDVHGWRMRKSKSESEERNQSHVHMRFFYLFSMHGDGWQIICIQSNKRIQMADSDFYFRLCSMRM
jgi:hypothetical protein